MSSGTDLGPQNLESDMLKLLNNHELSNVSFMCRDHVVVYAVKEILAARSDFFRVLLYGGMKESGQDQIQLPTAMSSHLLVVFEFLHSGKLKLPQNPNAALIVGVYELSMQYQLEELQKDLLKAIPSLLSKANVGPILEMSSEVTQAIV